MAKREAKSRPTPTSAQAPRGEMIPIRSIGIHCCIGVVLIGLIGAGLWYSKRYVAQRAAFPAEPPKVVIKDRPVWMSDHVESRIIETIRPAGLHSSFDRQMLVDRVKLLKNDPWIKEVRQVRRVFGEAPGDTIEIDCEFRAPIALVRWRDAYWYVDADGVKLPERFAIDDLTRVIVGSDHRTVLRVVEGIQYPPPHAGKAWRGEDVKAGIEMARLLYGKPYADEIVTIDVSNVGGRMSSKEAQIVLGTKRGTQVRWGRPYDVSGHSDSEFVEVPVARKLDYMSRVFAEFGQVDAKQPWIDIRFDRITYPVPDAQANSQE